MAPPPTIATGFVRFEGMDYSLQIEGEVPFSGLLVKSQESREPEFRRDLYGLLPHVGHMRLRDSTVYSTRKIGGVVADFRIHKTGRAQFERAIFRLQRNRNTKYGTSRCLY